MPIFVMCTRLSPDALKSPRSLDTLERKVRDRIRSECPIVEWMINLATLGPYDYVDIFRAPDIETATKIAVIVRSFGHAHTEIWCATEWDRFQEMIRDMPSS